MNTTLWVEDLWEPTLWNDGLWFGMGSSSIAASGTSYNVVGTNATLTKISVLSAAPTSYSTDFAESIFTKASPYLSNRHNYVLRIR